MVLYFFMYDPVLGLYTSMLFLNTVNVFTVTFKQYIAPLLNNNTKNCPDFWTVVHFSE